MKVRKLKWRFSKKKGGPRGWGIRCKDYFPGCSCCEFYRYYDENGRFPTSDEVHEITSEINKREHEAWLLTDEGKAWLAKWEK